MKNNILVISNMYPSKDDPYYGTFVENFISDLKQYTTNSNIDLCTIKGRSYKIVPKVYKYIKFYILIIYKLLFFSYDLVYVHIITHAALPLRFVSLFKKLPFVFNIHGEDLITQTSLSRYFLKLITPLLIDSQLIVVPSIYFKTKVKTLLPMIPEHKIFVSASGGVKEYFYTENRSQNNKYLRIGYVSRIDRGKGWDTFIKAAKILKDRGLIFDAQIVGRGTEIGKMNDLLLELQLGNVTYIGPVEYKSLPEIYRNFDLFIFPTKLEESLGLVGLEAMACCTPVIGSKIGGLTDYIEDGKNGYFFETGNEFSLADIIHQYYYKSDVEKKRLRENAYNKALSYRSDIVSCRLFKKLGLELIS